MTVRGAKPGSTSRQTLPRFAPEAGVSSTLLAGRGAPESRRRVVVGLIAAIAAATFAGPAAAAGEQVQLEIRVIEAKAGAREDIDPRLKALAKDLRSLPFRQYRLVDNHKKTLGPGERLSFQFPGPGKQDERFLVVTSQGEKGGKLRFSLQIDALKFRTNVAVPNGGTILVGGPRTEGGNMLFAVTARRR